MRNHLTDITNDVPGQLKGIFIYSSQVVCVAVFVREDVLDVSQLAENDQDLNSFQSSCTNCIYELSTV